MLKTVQLIIEANVPINGIIYSNEIMKYIEEDLNQMKYIPVVVNINPDEYNNPPVGRVLPKTAFFDGTKIFVDIDLREEHLVPMIDSEKYVIGLYITAKLDKNNNVIYSKIFNVNEIQIIKNVKRSN